MPQPSTPRGAGEIIVRKKAAVTLTLKEGPREVQAYVTSSPFLFVHRPYQLSGGGLRTDAAAGWNVTHGPTGLGCCGRPFDHLAQAIAYAERFAVGAAMGKIPLGFTDSVAEGVDMMALGKVHAECRSYVLEHIR